MNRRTIRTSRPLPRRPSEAQGIEGGDDLGPHAVDVAHDAADAGRRPLHRHDLAGMVVAFVSEDDAVSLAVYFSEIDDTRVVDRTHDHIVPGGREVGDRGGDCSYLRWPVILSLVCRPV